VCGTGFSPVKPGVEFRPQVHAGQPVSGYRPAATTAAAASHFLARLAWLAAGR
jgi:hypothetical protein